MTEDLSLCANFNCGDMSCIRNPRRANLLIPHSFCLFSKCEKWPYKGAESLTEQIKDVKEDHNYNG